MKKLFLLIPVFLIISFCNNPTDVKQSSDLVGKWIVRDHYNDTTYQRDFEFTNDYKFHNVYSRYIRNILDQQKILNGKYAISGKKLTLTVTDKTEEPFYYYYEIKFELLHLYSTDYSDTLILVQNN